MSWVEHGSHVLKDLNFEHVRLQRLKKALADKAQLKTVVQAVREFAKHKVLFINNQPAARATREHAGLFLHLLLALAPNISATVDTNFSVATAMLFAY